ncbi:MAG: hypothetical protein ACRDV9_14090 [Acidimicrobiia bacterium]
MVRPQQGDVAGAEASLQDAVADALNVPSELPAVVELALLLADTGRPDDAELPLKRGREIISGGGRGAAPRGGWPWPRRRSWSPEGWCTRPARGSNRRSRCSGASPPPGTRRRRGIAGGWRARLDDGDRIGAVRPLGQAVDLYQRHGAGRPWIERAVADKLLAQGVEAGRSVGASIDIVAAAALDERLDLTSQTPPDGTVTLLFSDIEGSTQSEKRLGDRRWLDLLHTHNRILRHEVRAHEGFEVKSGRRVHDRLLLGSPGAGLRHRHPTGPPGAHGPPPRR